MRASSCRIIDYKRFLKVIYNIFLLVHNIFFCYSTIIIKHVLIRENIATQSYRSFLEKNVRFLFSSVLPEYGVFSGPLTT